MTVERHDMGILRCKVPDERLVVWTGGHDTQSAACGPVEFGEGVRVICGVAVCIIQAGMEGRGERGKGGEDVLDHVRDAQFSGIVRRRVLALIGRGHGFRVLMALIDRQATK